uniref:Putative pbp/gobp family n=1 Tax=Corethrella appendiculata TaxID=1370023 RepID=U5EJ67_9DIPT
MKFLILLICITFVSAETLTEVVIKYFGECKQSLSVPDENRLAEYKQTIMPDEEPHQCFTHCVGQKFNIFDDTNEAKLDFFEKTYTPEVNDQVKICLNDIKNRDNKCKWTYDFIKCARVHMPNPFEKKNTVQKA